MQRFECKDLDRNVIDVIEAPSIQAAAAILEVQEADVFNTDDETFAEHSVGFIYLLDE